MKRYNVKITETHSTRVTVDADDPQDARDITEQEWRSGIHQVDEDTKQVKFIVSQEQDFL